jgi:5-methylcytosine-specific restriction enzyme subunit McrC
MIAGTQPKPASIDTIYWTEYGIPIRNLWYMLLYAWNELPIGGSGDLENIEDAPTLDALLASMLLKLMNQRLRIGIGRNYVNEKHLLRGVRGRISFSDSLKQQTFERGQAYCEFQEYSVNAPKNQIVRSTLMRLIQTGQFGPVKADELRHSLRRLVRDLDGIDLIELKIDFIRRQQLGRNDKDYRLMLAICELILQRQMPSDSNGHYNLPVLDRDALVFHSIFERFVVNFYRNHLEGWTITPQKYFYWHEKDPNSYLPIMKPDIVLKEKTTGRIVIVDTKFTAKSIIENKWGGEKFDSHHLYQMYAYMKTQEHISEQHRKASGILLYPAINQTELSEEVKLQDQTLRIESVDLTRSWLEIEQVLLKLILL